MVSLILYDTHFHFSLPELFSISILGDFHVSTLFAFSASTCCPGTDCYKLVLMDVGLT